MEAESCFVALKETAVRLDLEIDNARNRLRNPRFNSSLELAKFMENIQVLEKDLLAKKTRLDNIIQRQAAAYSHHRKEFEDLQLNLKEAIQKMQSHGIAELEHILPAADCVFEQHEIPLLQGFGDTALDSGSPGSREPTVQKLDFCPSWRGSKEKKSSQQAKPSSLPSILKQVMRNSDGLDRGPNDTYIRGRSSRMGHRLKDDDSDDSLLQLHSNRTKQRQAAEAFAVHEVGGTTPELKVSPKWVTRKEADATTPVLEDFLARPRKESQKGAGPTAVLTERFGAQTPELTVSSEWTSQKQPVPATPVLEDFLTRPLKENGFAWKNTRP